MQDATNTILSRLLLEMVMVFFPENNEEMMPAFYVRCVSTMIKKDPWGFIEVIANSVQGSINPRWGYVFYDRLKESQTPTRTPMVMGIKFIRLLTNSGLKESKHLFDSYKTNYLH